MNVSADQVRAATRLAADVITPDTVPPLRLDASLVSHGRARRTRPAWFTPLAAAAAVVIVVVGSVAAGSWLARSGNGKPGILKPAASAGAFAGVPKYYVALGNPSLAVVRATATGATLVRITTSTPFAGVTGAADDRTFVLDAQREVVTGFTVQWPDPPKFYLLRLTASGTEESYRPLTLPALPKGTAVSGLALSPDGSKLAVAVAEGPEWPTAKLLEIRVYTLATGASRTWSTTWSTDPQGASQSISWAADSRTLALDWSDRSEIGVRLLDTTASGDNLIADSRLAVINVKFGTKNGLPAFPFPAKDKVSSCVTDEIISLDGSAIVCGYTTNIGGHSTTTGFISYSTGTGKPTRLLGVSQFRGQARGDISLYWVNSTGTTLIGGILTPRGIQVGVINGEKFTPLPGIGGLGGAAW